MGEPSGACLGEVEDAWTRTCRAELADRHRRYAMTGDPALRAELVAAYEGFARSLAARFARNWSAAEDLGQAALVGLLKALDRFDPERQVQFTTYAWATITGELKRHVRDRSWAIRVPREVQERYLEVHHALEGLTHELRRSPTISEVGARIGAGENEVVEVLEAGRSFHLTSLDAHGGDEAVAMRTAGDDPEMARVESLQVLSPLLSRLGRRERVILHLRFVEDMTQAEIAARVGVSQMHVSRLLARSLSLLREWATHDGARNAG